MAYTRITVALTKKVQYLAKQRKQEALFRGNLLSQFGLEFSHANVWALEKFLGAMKKSAMQQATSRREFFRRTARYGMLSLLGALGVWVVRRGDLSSGNQGCPQSADSDPAIAGTLPILPDGCSACSLLARCELPQAISIRQRQAKG